MEKRNKILIIISSTILFTLLFHHQALGLNLMIFELSILGWLFFTKQFRFIGKNQISCTLGLVITMLATVLVYSAFAFFVNFLLLFLFVGILIFPDAQSLVNTFRLSLSNIPNSQIHFLREFSASKLKKYKITAYLWRLKIFFIPILVIALFLIIYSRSSMIFNHLLEKIALFLNNYLGFIFDNIDISILFTIVLGAIISIFILYSISDQHIIETDKAGLEFIKRSKNKFRKSFKLNGLKNELKAAIFMLLILNAILIVLNGLDIYWVWFNFEWNGLTLKQFVHEGTYLLILSIIISIIIVLYFFRNNLNFYNNNHLLKYLSYFWLAQNAILAVSVGIRNYWYIYFFSLAYKRIGVIIFLILCLYGLYTVIIKVKNKKSDFWLMKSNAYALVVVLVICSVFNWDTIIAKYNFKNSNRSFVHFDFLASLSDKSLPYLDKPKAELTLIENLQKENFPSERIYYITSEQYFQTIENRKESFKLNWESKNFLSWNLPEYLAYKKLFGAKK